MTYRELFEAELARFNVHWCRGGCDTYGSHTRGFAESRYRRVIHFDNQIATRASLYGGLHELGHIVHGHSRSRKPRWQREQEAETYARQRMREFGVPVPRKQVTAGDRYVARMKRWGDRIAAGRRT